MIIGGDDKTEKLALK